MELNEELIEKISSEYPYAVKGNHSTYNPYNEGWSDCCSRFEMELEDNKGNYEKAKKCLIDWLKKGGVGKIKIVLSYTISIVLFFWYSYTFNVLLFDKVLKDWIAIPLTWISLGVCLASFCYSAVLTFKAFEDKNGSYTQED